MRRSVCRSAVNPIPHGYGLAEPDRQRRHRLLPVVLAVVGTGPRRFGALGPARGVFPAGARADPHEAVGRREAHGVPGGLRDQTTGPGAAPGGSGQCIVLRRRVPQTHLVPQLRANGSAATERPALPPARVTGAAQALSRFHAGRRTAVERADEAPPGGAGPAWFEPAPSDPAPSDPPGTGR